MDKKDIKKNIIFPEDMWEQAKIQATKDRISLGEVVRQALREYLDRNPPNSGRSGAIPINDDYENFKSWFVDVLKKLYPYREAGFPILLITFPLLERYLRWCAKVFPPKNLDDKCMNVLRKLFPELGSLDDARKFWKVYRHGLLHTVTFSPEDQKGFPLPVGGASHDISKVIMKSGKIFWVHPVLFAQRVVSAIESDFKTFQGDPKEKSSLPKIVLLGGGTAGTSGPGYTQFTNYSYYGTRRDP
jgi:hypothetical protein